MSIDFARPFQAKLDQSLIYLKVLVSQGATAVAALKAINASLHSINERLNSMTTEVSALVAQVTNLKMVEQSVLALINGIPKLIAEAVAKVPSMTAEDSAAIVQATADIQAQAHELAAAVTANTPAA